MSKPPPPRKSLPPEPGKVVATPSQPGKRPGSVSELFFDGEQAAAAAGGGQEETYLEDKKPKWVLPAITGGIALLGRLANLESEAEEEELHEDSFPR